MLTNCEAFQPQVYSMLDQALPLPQSEAFERTCAQLGLSVQRVTTATGTCLVQTRKLPLLGAFNLISRGPILTDGAAAKPFLDDVRQTLTGPLVVNAGESSGLVGGLKIASGAILAMLDLEDPEVMRRRLHQKWRNQLKKAESGALTVTEQPLDADRHRWFLEAEMAQQKARKYRNYPANFLLAFAAANKGQARLYISARKGHPVAGMLILKHGRMATYQAGITTPEGRKSCAHNLLLWRIMCDLQKRQVAQLDLGRADLSDGLRRFKSGTGARDVTLQGSFLSHPWFRLGRSKRSLQVA